jgi:hypothetical protein
VKRTEKYICSCCGKEHESWPAIAFDAPIFYYDLNEEDKANIATLDSDFCVINHPEQTDRFIRCTLTIKLNNHCENLEYGVWVSLSEKSFTDYTENYNNENHATKYFGWLSNMLPDYEDTTKIPTTIFTRIGKQRPEVVPHSNFDHQLTIDYYNGITKKEAEKRIKETTENKESGERWWTKIFRNKKRF